MAEVQWYYAHNDQQFGPVSAAELKQLAESGRLTPDDLLWREGMEAWTTAVNLRGLFGPPADGARSAAETPPPEPRPMIAATRNTVAEVVVPRTAPSLRAVLRGTQIILWTTSVLVVLLGLVLFTRAFLQAGDPAQEASAAAVFATFFLAAYVLARSGEKLARLLLARSRRRR